MVQMKYSWSCKFCLAFSAKPAQGWIQGGAKIGEWGAHSPKDFYLRLERNKQNGKQWYRCKRILEEVLLFLVPFFIIIFDAF